MELIPFVFCLPAAASAGYLLVSWDNHRRPGILVIWGVAALLLQFVAVKYSPAWAIGLAAQTVLAVYLGIRWKLA